MPHSILSFYSTAYTFLWMWWASGFIFYWPIIPTVVVGFHIWDQFMNLCWEQEFYEYIFEIDIKWGIAILKLSMMNLSGTEKNLVTI